MSHVVQGPDAGWDAHELLAAADAVGALGPEWLTPLALLAGRAGELELSGAERLTLAVVLQRCVNVADGRALLAWGEVATQTCLDDSPHCTGSDCDHAWEVPELAAATGLSDWAVSTRRGLATSTALAPLVTLLADGRTTTAHLLAADKQTRHLSPDLAAEAVGRTLHRAGATVAKYRASLHRAVLHLEDPADAAARAEKARRRKTGTKAYPLRDGLAGLSLTGPVEQVEALRHVLANHPDIRSAATDCDPDVGPWTLGQAQLSWLVDLCTDDFRRALDRPVITFTGGLLVDTRTGEVVGRLGDDDLARTRRQPGDVLPAPGAARPEAWAWLAPPPRGIDPDRIVARPPDGDTGALTGADAKVLTFPTVGQKQCPECGHHPGKIDLGITVIAPAGTFLGLSDEPGSFATSTGGPLAGDAVPAHVVRRLALQAGWARVAEVDQAGVVVNLGRRRRLASRDQRAAMSLRHPTCRFPSCSRPAARCDADHADEWRQGGRTDLGNQIPLCERHHYLKDQGWRVTAHADGRVTWVSPAGRTHTVDPQRWLTTEAYDRFAWQLAPGDSTDNAPDDLYRDNRTPLIPTG